MDKQWSPPGDHEEREAQGHDERREDRRRGTPGGAPDHAVDDRREFRPVQTGDPRRPQRAADRNQGEGKTLAANWESIADGRILSAAPRWSRGWWMSWGNFRTAVGRARKLADVEDANLVSFDPPMSFGSLFRLFGKAQSEANTVRWTWAWVSNRGCRRAASTSSRRCTRTDGTDLGCYPQMTQMAQMNRRKRADSIKAKAHIADSRLGGFEPLGISSSAPSADDCRFRGIRRRPPPRWNRWSVRAFRVRGWPPRLAVCRPLRGQTPERLSTRLGVASAVGVREIAVDHLRHWPRQPRPSSSAMEAR